MHHGRGAVTAVRWRVCAAALLSLGCYHPQDFTSSNTGVARIVVTSTASLQGTFPGDQVQITAYAADALGAPLSVPVSYASSVTSVATVSTTGLITGVSAGNTVIVLTAGAATLQLPFLVDGNITGSIVVGPNTAVIKVGAQQLFTSVVLTTKGNPARGKTVTWSSTDQSRATVDATGRATAIATTASVSICAAAVDVPSVTGCATASVTP